MGLDDLLGGKPQAEQFADNYIDRILEDPSLHMYFFDASGKERTDDQALAFRKRIRGRLMEAYDLHAQKYFEDKGLIAKYLAPELSLIVAGADLAVTYLFWTLGGAGLGLKAGGLGAKTLADALEGAHYLWHNHEGYDLLELPGLVGETALERMAAYLPLGVGELTDLVRGGAKFDDAVAEEAIKYTRQKVFEDLGKEYTRTPKKRRVVAAEYFRDPAYAAVDTIEKGDEQQRKRKIVPLSEFLNDAYVMV